MCFITHQFRCGDFSGTTGAFGSLQTHLHHLPVNLSVYCIYIVYIYIVYISQTERIDMSVTVLQRLEESVLSDEKRLTVRGPSPDDPPTCLPARVREIVTKNLNDNGELQYSALRFHSFRCLMVVLAFP